MVTFTFIWTVIGHKSSDVLQYLLSDTQQYIEFSTACIIQNYVTEWPLDLQKVYLKEIKEK